jgi:hypothetical protein
MHSVRGSLCGLVAVLASAKVSGAVRALCCNAQQCACADKLLGGFARARALKSTALVCSTTDVRRAVLCYCGLQQMSWPPAHTRLLLPTTQRCV